MAQEVVWDARLPVPKTSPPSLGHIVRNGQLVGGRPVRMLLLLTSPRRLPCNWTTSPDALFIVQPAGSIPYFERRVVRGDTVGMMAWRRALPVGGR